MVGKSYDSYDAVLQVINTVAEKEQIYVRINRPLSIKSYNKRKDVSTISVDL